MKNYKITSLLLAGLLALGCEQEVLVPEPPAAPATPTGTKGSLDLSKFVTIGNSLVAGYQSSALFTEGQNESLGKILNQQFKYAGGTSEFNQPDINSENGFSGFIPSTTTPLGRLILFDPDGTGPRSAGPAASASPAREVTCPSSVSTPAVPAPYNTAISPLSADWTYTGDKTKLNNFGVPGILLGQVLTPLTGGPPINNPAYNTYYARFASTPGVSTILNDAIAAKPTFYLIEIGNNDVLGYATTGASGAIPLTTEANFNFLYTTMIGTIISSLPDSKGVIANIPDVTSIPFFLTVLYNSIPMDAATATQVNAAFAGYNTILESLKKAPFNYAAEVIDSRKISYSESKNNRVLIQDESVKSFKADFDLLLAANQITAGQRAALVPFEQVRQANATDLLTLSAGGVLGTCFGGNATALYGITVPLPDQYVLVPSEIAEIKTRTAAFNSIISKIATDNANRLALADVNKAFNDFVAARGTVSNGILLTPSITPPYAAFSEDGVHPNGRGYAFLANIFIDAINAKFGATIPKADVTKYRGTRTPITPTLSY